jgi:methylated-DNA-[protein]-cysteine S-methyltransferase
LAARSRDNCGVSGWWRQNTPIGPITVVTGPRGVAAISWSTGDADELGIVARSLDAPRKRDRAVASALDEWFAGERKDFDLDVDLSRFPGAPFGHQVLDTLRREVGWGEVVTYGELAEMAGSPGAARAVGNVMAHNPVPFVVPCHRVIAAGGRLGGYGGTKQGATRNLEIKRWLLAHEGVLLFDD